MKRSTSSSAKKASSLYQSIHQQLSVYAGAAVVAVVSLLALTQPSEAKIVYTRANVVLSCQEHPRCYQQYYLDLNHDGVTDFTITIYSDVALPCSFHVAVAELPAHGDGVMGTSPAALNQGAQIGHGQSFYGGYGVMAFYESARNSCFKSHGGAWYNVTDRYLGVSFQVSGRTHYGWARLNVGAGNYAKLTGYAYETIPGKSIIAGQTKGAVGERNEEDFGPGASLTSPIPDSPQPASLGMLALGAQASRCGGGRSRQSKASDFSSMLSLLLQGIWS